MELRLLLTKRNKTLSDTSGDRKTIRDVISGIEVDSTIYLNYEERTGLFTGEATSGGKILCEINGATNPQDIYLGLSKAGYIIKDSRIETK